MIAIGFILGFVGYLPLGNINLTVVQLAVTGSRQKTQLFILFAALMEFIYCFACLYGMDKLTEQQQSMVYFNWSAVVIFLALGLFTFFHKVSDDTEAESNRSVKRGVFVAIVNPLQIPFWLVSGVYVFENKWVMRDSFSIALFSFLCALGTIAILWLYAVSGKKLVERLKVNRNTLNKFIGSLFIALAVFQAVKTVYH